METSSEKLVDKYDNKLFKYLSDISYYQGSNIGLAKPENKIKIFGENFNRVLDNMPNSINLKNVLNLPDFSEDKIEKMLNHPNMYVSIFSIFKLNGVTYTFNDINRYADIDEIYDLLDQNKSIVIFTPHIDFIKDNIQKYSIIVFDEPISIQIKNQTNDYYSKILDNIITALKSGEKNESVNNMILILEKIRTKNIDRYEVKQWFYDNKPISVDPETARIANEKCDLFIKNIDDYVLGESCDDGSIDGMLNTISLFNDGDDPYTYLDFVDNFDVNKLRTNVNKYTNPKIYQNIITMIDQLNNHPIIQNKKILYDKWKNEIIEIDGYSKYKIANNFECIDNLINCYNNIYNIKINRKLCLRTTNSAMSILFNEFNVIDFIEKYVVSITTKYESYVSFIRKHKPDERDLNGAFAKEFVSQYVRTIKPEFDIKLI